MECILDKLDVKETPRDIYNTLSECGCCDKCILRFLGIKHYGIYAIPDRANEHLKKLCLIKSSDEEEEIEPQLKRRKLSTCVSCLGILTNLIDDISINHVADEIKAAEFDAVNFLLSVSAPVCLPLRQFSILLYLRDKYPAVYDDVKLEDIPMVKEVWKWCISSILGSRLGMKFSPHSSLDVVVIFQYEKDIEECQTLDQYIEKPTKKKSKVECLWSRAVMDSILSSSISKKIQYPPVDPENPCRIQSVVCTHSSIFLAGRYNKYSRTLSQTPWLIDGEKHTATSVQELICDFIYPWMKPKEIVFSASGREDVDVRTLGRGRPFILQVINPHRTLVTLEETKEISDKINNSSKDIAVRDLQVISKNETKRLKEGEETKMKSYLALCYSKDTFSQADMDILQSITELNVKQKSPIRVLHRRSLAVRNKIIHTMKAELVDEHHFRLSLLTQAGTYIKEFVHGDFGRTKPNICDLLGKEVDILELDVESIELDWPPELK